MFQDVNYHFLEGRTKGGYVSFGATWEQGAVSQADGFHVTLENSEVIPAQTGMMALWPDGSVKWSKHTACIPSGNTFRLGKGALASECSSIITNNNGTFHISVGCMTLRVCSGTDTLFEDAGFNGKALAQCARSIYIEETRHEICKCETRFVGFVETATVEENGALRATLKLEGIHKNAQGEERIPFIIRLIFHRNAAKIGLVYTFFYDGNPDIHFMKGLGIETTVSMMGELWNRHVKLLGDNGYLHETAQLLLGGKPRLPLTLYEKQMAGIFLNTADEADDNFREIIDDVTVWDHYKMSQISSESYRIEKGTGKPQCSMIQAISGKRAGGLGAAGGYQGGIAIAQRDFWQKYPSGIEFCGLSKTSMKATAWLYTPDERAYDFRHYDTEGHKYAYYEGFDSAGGDPYGIANTSELTLFLFSGEIPADNVLDEWHAVVDKPAVALASPEYYHDLKAFGEWSLVDESCKTKRDLEQRLDSVFMFYQREIEQRKWYGMFNYGDFMHSYDNYRHCWKYDMGGYAWQNTELVSTTTPSCRRSC